jgi:hypothetical protein
MRNDLPSMSTGRAMAQASHASNAFISDTKHLRFLSIKKWQKQTPNGFGTAIVLEVDLPTIHSVFKSIQKHIGNNGSEICYNEVIDPEYGVKTTLELYQLFDRKLIQTGKTIFNGNDVIFFKKEVTCAYVFGTKEELDPILGHLKLHP